MADDLPLGVYEDIVTSALEQRLASLVDRQVDLGDLVAAEAPDRFALHLATAVRRALDGLALDRDRSRVSAELIVTLLRQLEKEVSHYEASADLPVAHPPSCCAACSGAIRTARGSAWIPPSRHCWTRPS